jgi:HAD domain in Swiss Army Knife RNA repair proteins/Cysteine-rich CPCC
MTILLDIDGVLVTTPSWKPVEHLSDGFMKFSEDAVLNLATLYKETNAEIVLTTTHRINYSESQWKEIFELRGLNFTKISKINNKTEISQLLDRAKEIKEWIKSSSFDNNYVIIDDDPSINSLEESIKERWVATKPLIGFDKDSKENALHILKINSKYTCPCCGHKTYFEKPGGTYGICQICYWEDDPYQLENPDEDCGANPISLRQAQKEYDLLREQKQH